MSSLGRDSQERVRKCQCLLELMGPEELFAVNFEEYESRYFLEIMAMKMGKLCKDIDNLGREPNQNHLRLI